MSLEHELLKEIRDDLRETKGTLTTLTIDVQEVRGDLKLVKQELHGQGGRYEQVEEALNRVVRRVENLEAAEAVRRGASQITKPMWGVAIAVITAVLVAGALALMQMMANNGDGSSSLDNLADEWDGYFYEQEEDSGRR